MGSIAFKKCLRAALGGHRRHLGQIPGSPGGEELRRFLEPRAARLRGEIEVHRERHPKIHLSRELLSASRKAFRLCFEAVFSHRRPQTC